MPYTNVAILIHWVTAIIIIGLIAVGKFMTGLDEADPLRFELTQTHKTFGILILLLSVLRIVWRLTHRPPAHPADAPAWEKFAANASHLGFYALILALPLSGWAMVSVSTLNIDTLLFNLVEWPHLPIAEWLNLNDNGAKELWEHRFHSAHRNASFALFFLLFLHIGAALKHHFINKDDVLRRMAPRWRDSKFLLLLAAVAAAVGAAVFTAKVAVPANAPLTAQSSQVFLVATISSEETLIQFENAQITANIDRNNLQTSSLEASVDTGSAVSDNLQVQGSLPDADWFDAANHPSATFQSEALSESDTPNALTVSGVLSVKGTPHPVTFTLLIEPDASTGVSKASAEIPVNRFELELGNDSQPTEEYVNSTVLIRVAFELSANN